MIMKLSFHSILLCSLASGVLLSAEEERQASAEHAQQLMDAGKFREAEQEFTALVQADVASLGEQNPKTLADRISLARVKTKTGDSIESENELRAVLAILTRRRGPEHEETLACRVALARLLDELHRSHEAETQFSQILEIRTRMLGPDDIIVARTQGMLADVYSSAGEYTKAIPYYRKATVTLAKVSGPDDRETLLLRSSLAYALGENTGFDESEKEFREILAIRKARFGGNDASVYVTMFHLARVMAGHGKLDEAHICATEALAGLKSCLEPTNSFVVRCGNLCRELETDIARKSTPVLSGAPSQ